METSNQADVTRLPVVEPLKPKPAVLVIDGAEMRSSGGVLTRDAYSLGAGFGTPPTLIGGSDDSTGASHPGYDKRGLSLDVQFVHGAFALRPNGLVAHTKYIGGLSERGTGRQMKNDSLFCRRQSSELRDGLGREERKLDCGIPGQGRQVPRVALWQGFESVNPQRVFRAHAAGERMPPMP